MIISITMNPKPNKLLDRVRETIRPKKYSLKTEHAYLHWIKQYILFHDKKHHKHESVLQKAVCKAAIKAGVPKMR